VYGKPSAWYLVAIVVPDEEVLLQGKVHKGIEKPFEEL
jgi:hypothetical protein